MPAPMNFWDIAAGILIGGGLILAMIWGGRRGSSERPFLWIAGAFAVAIVLWRADVWYGAAHPDHADLYAKYGLAPPDHQ